MRRIYKLSSILKDNILGWSIIGGGLSGFSLGFYQNYKERDFESGLGMIIGFEQGLESGLEGMMLGCLYGPIVVFTLPLTAPMMLYVESKKLIREKNKKS